MKQETILWLLGAAVLLYGWNAGWFSNLAAASTTVAIGPCPAGYNYSWDDPSTIYCVPSEGGGLVVTVPNSGVL